ncbi:MAG: hypothetical protein HFH67_13100 [Lachnospiraceae bacterium]|nr:hypothetical protein [Lachnospiraceae bacterium]
METSISHKINITAQKAAYDTYVKKLLSEKIILAHILASVVTEFNGMTPEEIIPLIEGQPDIENVSIIPGETSMPSIIGDNTEDIVPNEGKVTFDIRFSVRIPGQNGIVKIIIDIEAQKRFYPGYDLVTRGIFYAARLLSSQLGTEFTLSAYNNIKKVYSIWICIDCPKYAVNTVTRYHITQENLVGCFPKDKARYDLLETIMICLSNDIAPKTESLHIHRLLGILLSPELKVNDKKTALSEEFNIPMTIEMERMVADMCNLSDLIVEKSWQKGIEQGIEQGHGQGIKIMGQLSIKLAKDGRIDDISLAMSDKSYMQMLLKEYGIDGYDVL